MLDYLSAHLSPAAPLSSSPSSSPSAAPELAASPTTTLFLILEPVDMRLGIDGLSAVIQTRLTTSPCAGGIYLFMNARRNRLKLLLWDGTGVWLAVRRLHKGRFIFCTPECSVGAGAIAAATDLAKPAHLEVSHEQWRWLIAGVDWQRLSEQVSDHAHWRVG